MKKINIIVLCLLSATLFFSACSRFLEEKSDLKLTTPETLEDNQALLDRITDVLTNFALSGMSSSDDFYLTDADYTGLGYDEDKRLYTWQADYVSTNQANGNDWMYCYRAIFIANSVLYNIENYNIPNSENVRGQALVIRAARYLDGAQTWCTAYQESTADQAMGLPLRLDPDMNTASTRSTLRETYAQIIKDLKEAVPLLPPRQVAVSRPSKASALAYLARVYLVMGNYEESLRYSLQALEIQNTLMDFNALNINDSYPIKDLNAEVILRASMRTAGPSRGATAKVPPSLYDSYAPDDLRKAVFFRINADQTVLFRGNYTGNLSGKLSGVAVDEVYLMAAECYARSGKTTEAMTYVNALLQTRWKAGTYVPMTANNSQEALAVIQTERRKELLFRGLRWMDLKRYNRDGANIVLIRTVLGQTYTLQPNDLRYAIAIPEDIVELSGIPQNPR
ncbi:MAG: RagB/SusD family nutrient uptake outer membrane protein [Pedobacter sp.]|nr:MAG: RagB/SusD family nutrient uptake outer membrane protein [Pedobacter sp.]